MNLFSLVVGLFVCLLVVKVATSVPVPPSPKIYTAAVDVSNTGSSSSSVPFEFQVGIDRTNGRGYITTFKFGILIAKAVLNNYTFYTVGLDIDDSKESTLECKFLY